MSRIKYLVYTCFFLFFAFSIYAKNYRITQLSISEGLSQQDIECIIQDKFGYIWIGSYDGLNRYDGNQLTIYRHIPNDSSSINDNRILALAEWPSRDELWVGTEGGGLSCFDQKRERFVSYENDNPGGNQVITCLHQYDNALWVGSMNGLSKITFDERNKMTAQPFTLKGMGDYQHVNSISHDSQGNIIVGTWGGIYSKSPNENVFHQYMPGIEILRIICDNSGNLWTLTSKNVFYYSISQQQIKSYLSTPFVLDITFKNDDLPKSITAVTDRLFLLNSKTQLFWIHQQDKHFSYEEINFFDKSFLKNNEFRSAIIDNTMNVWITSSMEGVARFDLNQKMIYQKPVMNNESDERIFIQSMMIDSKERLWIGTNLGCFISNLQTQQSHSIQSIKRQILGLLSDTKGNVWCTSLSGLDVFKNGDETQKISLSNLPGFPSSITLNDGPYGLCEDAKNEIVWVGFRSGLLQAHYHDGKFSFKHYDRQLFATPHLSNITKIFLDQSTQSLLIGTATSGLFSASLTPGGDIQSITKIETHTNDKKEDHIWTIFQASNGVIYAGTDSGLKQLKKNEKGVYVIYPSDRNDPQLQSYKITSILEDQDNNLWLSTGLGLISYNLETNELRKYLNSDGLASFILTEGACFDAKNNRLYVGGIKGLNVVDLTSLRVNEIPPRTIIQSIKINNQPIHSGELFNKRVILPNSLNYTEEIKLKYFENNISFDFAALHFSNPEKNQYAYKLEEFNHDWVQTGTIHSATFTNLPAGKYTLLVKSSNGDGVWQSEPLSLRITVPPAPWKSAWAYLIYTLLAGAIVFLIYRYFKEKHRMRQELLMKQLEHQKKMEIAEVKLKYHTNITHELRTPLSLILAPVQELITAGYSDEFLSSRIQNIKNNADRLLQLVGQFLDMRKVISDKYILRIKRQQIDQPISEIKKNFEPIASQKRIALDLYNDAGSGYYWCDIEIINKICYNLISNAIKYTPESGRVTIYVSTNTDSTILFISVEDTGAGIPESEMENIFERFYQAPDSVGGTGIGLHLSQHLASLHKGKISVISREEEGTIFRVEFPVYKDAFDESEIIQTEDEIPEEHIPEAETENPIGKTTGNPLVLVVEDNYEFRKYMLSLLSGEFNLIEAENGETGYETAVSRIPDLIVSDIMMPVMDGIELVKKCKENMLTSHIPFLLLTAKDTIESEVEGLTYGAEDYITKPFNIQTLKLKIRNLIKLTRKKDDSLKETEQKPVMNERDRTFVTKFEKVVLDNISVPDFGIEDICLIMGISRMQFHRKMSALFSQKPSQYIKEIRMKKAYELMTQKGLNITETMQEVGYTNHSYFSKLFIEVNGKSPRNVMGMKEKELL